MVALHPSQCKLPLGTRLQTLAGRDASGAWRTAAAKQYGPGFSRLLATALHSGFASKKGRIDSTEGNAFLSLSSAAPRFCADDALGCFMPLDPYLVGESKIAPDYAPQRRS